MKLKWIVVIAFLPFAISTSLAQHLAVSPELAKELTGKTKFSEIMAAVEKYYIDRGYQSDPILFSEYKKWNRWAWYGVRHLNEIGEVDYKSSMLFEEAQRMQRELDANRSLSNSGYWTFIGPYTTTWANVWGSRGIGRIDRIAFHPANSNVIIAATPAGGLWKTNDGGFNWYSISPNVPNCGISGIVISEDDPTGNKIFILTGDGDSSSGGFVENYGFGRTSIGVLVTFNGGGTWAITGNSGALLAGRRGFKLLQVKGTPARLLACTNNGIYRSNDFGNTWALGESAGFSIFDLKQHPTDNTIVYAASSNSVMKSTNNGLSFTIFPTFTPGANLSTRTVLGVTPDAPNEVYFLQCGASNRLYQSTDSGNNYNSINTTDLIGGQYSYNCAFTINPIDNNFMVVGGINVRSSTNNGTTFGNVTSGNLSAPPVPANYIHPDIHDLAYTSNGLLVYAATDGGVFVSSDDGINWEDRSNGLACTQYYHMTGFDGTHNLFVGGAQDNGTAYTTDAVNMNYCGSGDGFSVTFVSGNNDVFYNVANQNIYRFTRSSNTRVFINPGVNSDWTFYPNLIAHPTDNNIVYAGYQNSIWRSSDQGANWTFISGIGTSNAGASHTGGFAVTAALPDRLYAADATTIRRSDNQGTNWTTVSGNPGWPASFGVITDLACRNTNANEIWVTTTGNNGMNRVLYSGDAGANWINFTGSLPVMPVYCIAYDDDGDAYVGTELGVFFMDFLMNDWVPFYNGMPLVPITDLFVNETFGIIQASTFGRGIWQSDLYSGCSPLLLLSGTSEGQQFFQSSGNIETSQVMPGSFGNELRLRAPQQIKFKNGFRSYNNSFLHAVIGDCGQGVFDMSGSSGTKSSKSENLKKIQLSPPQR